MAPKKSAKKKKAADSRGYATESIPSKPLPIVEGAQVQLGVSSCAGEPNLAGPGNGFECVEEDALSKEQADRRRHVAAEAAYLTKCKAQTSFRGRLYPPLPTEVQLVYNIPTKALYEEVVQYTHGYSALPPAWLCSSWNYDRAARNLHALESAGLPIAQCGEAIAAARGYDERAAFELAASSTVPEDLPPGWCEYHFPMAAPVVVSDDSLTNAEASRRARARDSQESHLRALQAARQLLHDTEREADQRLLPAPPTPMLQPPSPTSRYMELQSLQAQLTSAIKQLEKRERRTLEAKLVEVRAELAALRPNVDFRRPAGIAGESENAEVVETADAEAVDGVVKKDDVRSDFEVGPASEGESMFALFDEEQPVAESAGLAVSAEHNVFQYIITKNRAHKTPAQLLSEATTETRQFHYGKEGHHQWVETGEMGPLSAAAARRFGRPKGSFIYCTPTIPSRDTDSARQLACLRLMFEITLAGDRRRVGSMLAPCALKIWEQWAHETLSETERALHAAAEVRAELAERSLGPLDVAVHSHDRTIATSGSADESTRREREEISAVAVSEEIARRSCCGLFPLEDMRAQLPALRHAGAIVATINSNDVTIIAGDTGSGKSTQVPQLLLRACFATRSDEHINIIVTEPRRVAAISVSDRVSNELGDADRGNALCGYTVRLESNTGPRCVLEYVTVGVLLRRIQASRGRCLAAYSHCIVDEVHERSVDSDLLLLLLREYRGSMGDLGSTFPRLVLMSATADIDTISTYWRSEACNVGFCRIEGRTFPVDAFFLEETVEKTGYSLEEATDGDYRGDSLDALEAYDLTGCSSRTQRVLKQLDPNEINYGIIENVLRFEICENSGSSGAVIVFMPGLEEIKRVVSMIEADAVLSRRCVAVPMHSSLPADELLKAFRRVGPGRRKCVISTNICETGVTIEDVDLVIDTGFVKSVTWNEVTETSRLRLHMCSIAEATQRRGRAGRVRPGRCVHLFSRRKMAAEFEGERQRMKPRPEPEMRRAPLTAPILSLTDQGLGVGTLLKAPGETVSIAKLANAVQTLLELGALVDCGEVEKEDEDKGRQDSDERPVLSRHYVPTPLGRALAALPCDPRSGKVLLSAHLLGCLEGAAVFIASLDTKSVFNRVLQSDQHIRAQFGKRTESDAVTIVNAYSEWRLIGDRGGSRHMWCRQNGLSMPALLQVAALAKDLIRAVQSVTAAGYGVYSEYEEALQVPACPSNDLDPTLCLTCKTGIGMHTCVVSGCREGLHAAIATGMGKNVSFRSSPPDAVLALFSSGNKSISHCKIHRSSFVRHPGEYVVYCNQMIGQSGRQSLMNVVSIDAITMLLFSPWAKIYHGEGTVIVGRGIGVRLKARTIVWLRRLRADWESALIGNSNRCASGRHVQELTAVLFKLLLHNPLFY